MDSGLLIALQGQTPWDDIRRARSRDMQIAALENTLVEKQLAEQQAAGAQVQDYLNTIGKLKVLEQDVAPIEEENQRLSANIRKGILESRGDIRKWLGSGGMNELNRYKQGLTNSPAVQTGLQNAYMNQQYLADRKLGLTPREGTFLDEAGNEVAGNFDQQRNLYKEGKLKNLKYAGAFKEGTYLPKFSDRYSSKGRYKQVAVTPEELYEDMLQQYKGQMSPSDAEQVAKRDSLRYEQGLSKGATPLYYKFDEHPKDAAYWRWFYSSGREDDEQEEEGIKHLANVLNKSQDPNSDIWQRKEPGGLTQGANGFIQQQIGMSNALDGYQLKKAVVEVEEPTTTLKQNKAGQYEPVMKKVIKSIDNEILGLIYRDGKPMVLTTKSQIEAQRDGKSDDEAFIPLENLGDAELTAKFKRPENATAKLNKLRSKKQATQKADTKTISSNTIQGLIGKPGYEGYTAQELAEYYASQGYTIK